MSSLELCYACIKTVAAQGQGSYKENEDGLNATLPTPAVPFAVAPLSDNSSARGYERQYFPGHWQRPDPDREI
jgi:hypothetical protein